MGGESRVITPVEFVTFDPEIKRLATHDIKFHADTATLPRKGFHVCYFYASKCREQRLGYVSDVRLPVFAHVERRVERTSVSNHPLTVTRDLKAKRPVAIERKQQPQRLSVQSTIDNMAVRFNGVEPHALHAASFS